MKECLEVDEPIVNNPDIHTSDSPQSNCLPSSNTERSCYSDIEESSIPVVACSDIKSKPYDASLNPPNIKSDYFSSSLARSKMLIELGEFNYAKQLLISALKINPLSFDANLYLCLATYKLKTANELKGISYDCPYFRILNLCKDYASKTESEKDEMDLILSSFAKIEAEPFVGNTEWHSITFDHSDINGEDWKRLETAFTLRGKTLLGNDTKSLEGRAFWREAEKEYLTVLSINPNSSQGWVGLFLSRLQCHSFDDTTLIKRRVNECRKELGEALKHTDDKAAAERLIGLKHAADSYEEEEREKFEKAQEIKRINDEYEEEKHLRQLYAGKVISKLQSPFFRKEASSVIGEVLCERSILKNKLLIEGNLMGDFYDQFMVAYTQRMLGREMPEFLQTPEKWLPNFRECFRLTLKNETSIFDGAVKDAKKTKNSFKFRLCVCGFIVLFPWLIYLDLYLHR